MRFCTSCGTRLNDDARFCHMCGAKVVPLPAPAASEAEEKPPETLKHPEPAEARNVPEPPAIPEPPRPPLPPQPPRQQYFHDYTPPRGGRPAPPRPDEGRPHSPAGRPLKNRGALRFLSFLFALGLLALSVGLASSVFFGRFADRSLTAYLEKTEAPPAVTDAGREQFAAALRASVDGDIQAGVKAQQRFAGAEKSLSPDELALVRENNDRRLEEAAKHFGFRWTVLQLSGSSRIVMLAGGALAGLSLLLWFALGGRPAVFSKAAVTPLLTMFVIWGLLFVLAAFILPAVNIFDVDVPDRLERFSEPAPAEIIAPAETFVPIGTPVPMETPIPVENPIPMETPFPEEYG